MRMSIYNPVIVDGYIVLNDSIKELINLVETLPISIKELCSINETGEDISLEIIDFKWLEICLLRRKNDMATYRYYNSMRDDICFTEFTEAKKYLTEILITHYNWLIDKFEENKNGFRLEENELEVFKQLLVELEHV